MGNLNTSFSAQQKNSLTELSCSLASLSELFALGLPPGSEMEPEEVRAHILTSIRQSVCTLGACLLLYYKVQERFVPVASQGEKFPCGALASMISAAEVARLSSGGPGAALGSVRLEGSDILLVSLVCGDVFVGLVALTLVDALTEEQSLLLTYMGSVAAQILYMHDLRSRELRSAVVQERNRIARDLHDGVVQQLAYALYKLEIIQHLLDSGPTQQIIAEIERISTILQESLQELRSTTTSFLPSQLSMYTFNKALAALLLNFQQDNPAISLKQHVSILPPLSAELEAATFRVIQEALNNIRKHATATELTLRLELQADVLQLEIHDNGQGFDTGSVQNMLVAHSTEESIAHSGLRGMYQRIQEIGGTWHIASEPGAGTTIEARLPLLESASELTQREREVLQLIVAGLDNHAIAQKLSIMDETVKKHVQHITQKLHVKDRAQVAVMASKHNLHSFS
jgi:signal transduction histidine kinase